MPSGPEPCVPRGTAQRPCTEKRPPGAHTRGCKVKKRIVAWYIGASPTSCLHVCIRGSNSLLDRGAPKCTLHDRFITPARPSRQVVAVATPVEKSGRRILSIRPLSRRSTYPHVSPRGTPSPYAAGAHQAPLPSHL